MKHKKNQETKVYGRHACMAVFNNRPADIIRAYITQEGVFEFRSLIKYCAQHKLAYHVVEKEEIDAVTKATHHENIALIVKARKLPSPKELLSQKGRQLILALEEVENPHNLGAIMRTAAHFGVTGILYQAKVPVAATGAAQRTAEGGAESVPALHLEDWGEVFNLAKTLGFRVLGTSGAAGESLFHTQFPEKSLVFLGAEGKGLSDKMLKKMQGLITIPGTGAVESLNVSNATCAVLTEWFRQGHKRE
jgi:TrmH RNA methyltransferase